MLRVSKEDLLPAEVKQAHRFSPRLRASGSTGTAESGLRGSISGIGVMSGSKAAPASRKTWQSLSLGGTGSVSRGAALASVAAASTATPPVIPRQQTRIAPAEAAFAASKPATGGSSAGSSARPKAKRATAPTPAAPQASILSIDIDASLPAPGAESKGEEKKSGMSSAAKPKLNVVRNKHQSKAVLPNAPFAEFLEGWMSKRERKTVLTPEEYRMVVTACAPPEGATPAKWAVNKVHRKKLFLRGGEVCQLRPGLESKNPSEEPLCNVLRWAHTGVIEGVIEAIHKGKGHAHDKATKAALDLEWAGISPELVTAFCSRCKMCRIGKQKLKKARLKALIGKGLLTEAHVDLVDMRTATVDDEKLIDFDDDDDSDAEEQAEQHKAPKYVFCYRDRHSKFTIRLPLNDKSGASVAAAFDLVFGMGFLCSTLIADNGSEFKNAAVAAVLAKWNVVLIHSRPYHPETNGTVESSNKTLKTRLRALKLEYPNTPWWELLQLANYATNTVPVSTIKTMPYVVMFGKSPPPVTAPVSVLVEGELVDESVLLDLPHGVLAPLGNKLTAVFANGADSVLMQRVGVSGKDSNCGILALLMARNQPYQLFGGTGMPFRGFAPEAQHSFAVAARQHFLSLVNADSVDECNAVLTAGGSLDVASLRAALQSSTALNDLQMGFVAHNMKVNLFLVESCTQLKAEEKANQLAVRCLLRFDAQLPSIALFNRHHVVVSDLGAFNENASVALSQSGHFEAIADSSGVAEWDSMHTVTLKLCRLSRAADPDLGVLGDERYKIREVAKAEQIKAGERMVARSEASATTFVPALGDVVGVRLQKKHRAKRPLGPALLPGVIVEVKENGYRVLTHGGILDPLVPASDLDLLLKAHYPDLVTLGAKPWGKTAKVSIPEALKHEPSEAKSESKVESKGEGAGSGSSSSGAGAAGAAADESEEEASAAEDSDPDYAEAKAKPAAKGKVEAKRQAKAKVSATGKGKRALAPAPVAAAAPETKRASTAKDRIKLIDLETASEKQGRLDAEERQQDEADWRAVLPGLYGGLRDVVPLHRLAKTGQLGADVPDSARVPEIKENDSRKIHWLGSTLRQDGPKCFFQSAMFSHLGSQEINSHSCVELDNDQCLRLSALYAIGDRALADGVLFSVDGEQRLCDGEAVRGVPLSAVKSIVFIKTLSVSNPVPNNAKASVRFLDPDTDPATAAARASQSAGGGAPSDAGGGSGSSSSARPARGVKRPPPERASNDSTNVHRPKRPRPKPSASASSPAAAPATEDEDDDAVMPPAASASSSQAS